ncbi:hypothetical protein KJ780_02975 [Candidatus Micrarchaeota archaeon]|nr:hypothetical protein [Candidatus Micrarchaeota archaeon]
MSHVTTFKKFTEKDFGITLPKSVILQEHESVIRVYSKTLMMLKPSGYMGFVAGKVSTKGIEVKSEFIQMFGTQATKNIIQLNERQAKYFVESEFVEVIEDGVGLRIAKLGNHTLGIGKLKDKKFYPDFIGKGRKRVENSISP